MLDFEEDRYLSDKTDFIDAYFDKWKRDIERAETLLRDDRFVLEGYLVLVCYLGALASQRYHSLRDNEAYCQFTLEYSGKRSFYEQIDLLFLYQWPSVNRKVKVYQLWELKSVPPLNQDGSFLRF